jgi:hypothetical protein
MDPAQVPWKLMQRSPFGTILNTCATVEDAVVETVLGLGRRLHPVAAVPRPPIP